MTPKKAIKFLNEAARYFEKRPTNGEDRAHWANVYNAKNCRDIIQLIQGMEAVDDTLTRVRVHRAAAKRGAA